MVTKCNLWKKVKLIHLFPFGLVLNDWFAINICHLSLIHVFRLMENWWKTKVLHFHPQLVSTCLSTMTLY